MQEAAHAVSILLELNREHAPSNDCCWKMC